MKTIVVLTFLMTAIGAAFAADSAKNVRVVWSEDPQREAVVVWDGHSLLEDSVLLYDKVSRAGGNQGYAFEAAVSESGLYVESSVSKPKKAAEDWVSPGAGPEFYYHHAPLKGLKPNTTYYLAVKTNMGIGREFHFKTAPKKNQSFKIIYGGDSRTRMDMAREINQQISRMVAEDDSIAGVLHGGDYATTPRRDLWIEWLAAYDLSTTESGKLVPIIPVIGNHDVKDKSPIFRQAYGYPGGVNDYYTCNLTPSVSIVCLNTEISAEGNQRKFLKEELVQLKKKNIRWQIAAFHKPAFPAVKKPSVAKVSWVPLFEEFEIDLVLESDGHCIKRTVPILDDKEATDGIIYLGEGGYGAPQRDPKMDRWYLQGDNAFASKGDHVMVLEITPKGIHYTTVLNTGEVVDAASFQNRR